MGRTESSGEQNKSDREEVGSFGIEEKYRCRANSAHVRQSWPDSGHGFRVTVSQSFRLLPLRSAAVGSGRRRIKNRRFRGVGSGGRENGFRGLGLRVEG